jgi:hypothetical protein
MYEQFAMFERDTHKVDVGNAYLTDRSRWEMLVHLSRALLQRNVIDPLNTGARLYFSLLYGGKSFLILCKNGAQWSKKPE